MREASRDAELVKGVLAGRREDFAELVRRHHAAVLGLCASVLGDRTAADDAAQEVFLKAYGALVDFRSDSAFTTWLHRIAVNHCLDLRRRRARRAESSLDALLEAEAPRVEALLAGGPSRDPLEDADLAARVLAALPEEYRLILTLREVQGLSYKELMETLDCSMDAVKARLRRARESLRDSLRHIPRSGGV